MGREPGWHSRARRLQCLCVLLFLIKDALPSRDCAEDEVQVMLGGDESGDFARIENALDCIHTIVESSRTTAMFFDLTTRLYRAGQTKQALRMLDAALALVPTNSNFLFLRGSVLATSGRVDEAAESYENAAINHPTHVDALHNYAAILMDHPHPTRGRRDRILRTLDLALRLLPSSTKLKVSAGVILSELDQYEKAASLLLRATRIEQSALAFGALGRSLEAMGRDRQAERCYLRAVSISPHEVDVLRQFGHYYMAQQDPEEACAWFQKVLEQKHDDAGAMTGMGECLRGLKRLSDAVDYYRAAAEVEPRSAEGWSNYGSCLVETGNASGGLTALLQALALDPHLPQAHTTAGYALVELGRHREAGQHFRVAVETEPRHGTGWNNLGHYLRSQGKLAGAVEAGERAVALDLSPLHLYNLAESLRLHARLPEAIQRLQQAHQLDPAAADVTALLIFYRRLACDWTEYWEDTARLEAILASQRLSGDQTALFAVQTLIFPLPPHLHLFSASSLAAASERRSRLHPLPPLPPPPLGQSRLRLAYITSDFGKHPVADDLQAVWTAHDPARVEFSCYLTPGGRSADGGLDDRHPCRGGLGLAGIGVDDLREMGTREAAQRISSSSAAVLIDLHGWTAGHAMDILAFSPAPVQLSFKGFPWSSGASFIAMMVGDRVATPPEHRAQWTEQLLLHPLFYHVNGHWRRFEAPPSKPAVEHVLFEERGGELRVPPHSVLLCSFNRQVKLEPSTWDAWMRILHSVPGSLLWLLRFEEVAEGHLLRAAELAGVDAGRIFMTEPLPLDVELQGKAACDLFLDSFLYNAHGTAADAMWARTPIVTFPGSVLPSRVAAALALHPRRSFSALVARNAEDFVVIASLIARRMVAKEARQLRGVRDEMQAAVRHNTAAGVFDVIAWTRAWERGLAQAAECQTLSPGSCNIIVAQ